MPEAQVNGITIHYELSGSLNRDTLVLVNGLADSLETWSLQTPAFLAQNYRVLTYDNRGIGRSSRPAGPYTASLLAEDLHCLLEHLSVTTFHLLGISMGGMIAQAYALHYPNGSSEAGQQRMTTLTLSCTYAAPSLFCSRMFSFWADVAKTMGVKQVMRDVTLWAFTVPFFRERKADLEEVEKAMEELDMDVLEYLSQLNVIQQFDTTEQLAQLKKQGKGLGGLDAGKVMVLVGEEDILIPTVLSKEMAESIPESQYVSCKGGHACCWEFPDEFNDAVLRFLEQHRVNK